MKLDVPRSTTALVLGVLLAPLGVILLRYAGQLAARADLQGATLPESYATVATLGAMVLAAGVVYLVVGIVRLSRNVDLAAQAAAEQLRARDHDAGAPVPKD